MPCSDSCCVQLKGDKTQGANFDALYAPYAIGAKFQLTDEPDAIASDF